MDYVSYKEQLVPVKCQTTKYSELDKIAHRPIPSEQYEAVGEPISFGEEVVTYFNKWEEKLFSEERTALLCDKIDWLSNAIRQVPPEEDEEKEIKLVVDLFYVISSINLCCNVLEEKDQSMSVVQKLIKRQNAINVSFGVYKDELVEIYKIPDTVSRIVLCFCLFCLQKENRALIGFCANCQKAFIRNKKGEHCCSSYCSKLRYDKKRKMSDEYHLYKRLRQKLRRADEYLSGVAVDKRVKKEKDIDHAEFKKLRYAWEGYADEEFRKREKSEPFSCIVDDNLDEETEFEHIIKEKWEEMNLTNAIKELKLKYPPAKKKQLQ